MNKLLAYLPSVVLVALMVLVTIEPAAAQTRVDLGSLRINLFNPGSGSGGFANLFDSVLSLFLLFAGVAAFFYILYGGFVYLTAGGDPAKATQGRTYIVNAIIGIVIIFASYALAKFVIGLTQTNGRTTF